MNGQAALGLGSIVNRLLFVFPCSSFKALPADSLKLFMNSMTDLTCLFLQAVAKEEEVCTQLVLSFLLLQQKDFINDSTTLHKLYNLKLT